MDATLGKKTPSTSYGHGLRFRRLTTLRRLALVAVVMGCALNLLMGVSPAHGAGSRTLEDVYGVNRKEVVTWLSSHEKDTYYLTTPYRPFDWRSPNGDINGWGAASDGIRAGMNCTGFVWHGLCAAHGWRDDIGNRLPALNGWRDAIRTQNLETYSFSNKQAMLASGVLEKGDIIWMWDSGDASLDSDNHHVGIFWGDSPSEDRLWHSSGNQSGNIWSGANELTAIHGKAANVSFQVLKLGGKLTGAISLKKVSGAPGLSEGNSHYSLQGGIYGLFSTQSAAASHAMGLALRTLTTGADGTASTAMDVPTGSYYLSECVPPPGFALDPKVYPVSVKWNKTTVVNGKTVADPPISYPVELWANKQDGETPDGAAQGTATLKDTLFEICYYDGDYGEDDLPESPTRRWVVRSDEDGRALAQDDLLESGDAFYRTADGTITLPLGTVTIRELTPPSGYDKGDSSLRLFLLSPDGTKEIARGFTTPVFKNQVQRGGVILGKRDRQNGAFAPQGSATLDGAVFAIVNANPQPVMVDGTLYDEGAIVKTIRSSVVSSGRFVASTSDQCLPVGNYTLKETEAPEGYGIDEEARAWHRDFSITTENEMVDLTGPEASAADPVLRGDFSFTKADGRTGKRLASIPFAITSLTTGESHVVVTDENGMYSSAASWNPHSHRTNGNDGLRDGGRDGLSDGPPPEDPSSEEKPLENLNEEGGSLPSTLAADKEATDSPEGDAAASKDDESSESESPEEADPGSDQESGFSYDATAGLWFSGRTDIVIPPDDHCGALPYDSYVVTELPCPANAAYELAEFTLRITRDGLTLDLGTVDNHSGPLVDTSLEDEMRVKSVPANTTATIWDRVGYTNLKPGEDYSLEGSLHLVDSDGTDRGVITEGNTDFTPRLPTGVTSVEFTFDSTGLDGKRLVAIETLKSQRGEVLAVREDLAYEGQTARVPSLATTLAAKESGSKTLAAEGAVTLIDTVALEGLAPGTTYRVVGTLHLRGGDGTDRGPLRTEEGEVVIAQQDFLAKAEKETVEVAFTFDATGLDGYTVVAFEELQAQGKVYATHTDISDEGQSIAFDEAPLGPMGTELAKTGDGKGPLTALAILGTFIGTALGLLCLERLSRERSLREFGNRRTSGLRTPTGGLPAPRPQRSALGLRLQHPG